MLIVFAMITIIGLIASCLLNQLEHDADVFGSVIDSWYWTFCRLIGMKDTPYRSGIVTSIWGIAVLGCTLTLKGVLWIVPIERIKQIFSREYADVVSDKNLQADVKKEVKEILEGVHEDMEDLLKEGPGGYACAMLTIHSAAGPLEKCIPLPISKKTPFNNVGNEMMIELGHEMSLRARFNWKPDEQMDGLPFGQLSVTFVDAKLPPLADVALEVLVAPHQKEEKPVILDGSKGREMMFEIQWKAPKSTSKAASVQHQVADIDEFQVQVLQMLHEQEELIQEQQKKILHQSERLVSLAQTQK